MSRDRGILRQQKTEFIHAVEQAISRERLDGKGRGVPSVYPQLRFREVDLDLGPGIRKQPRVRGLVDDHRQQTVLQ